MTKIVEFKDYKEVWDSLYDGNIVSFPTDTVFGLASIIEDEAVQKLYEIKGRDNKPISVMCANVGDVKKVAYITEVEEFIVNEFMPGALTIVLKKKEFLPDVLTASLDTVGIRIPDKPELVDFLEKTGPLAVTSANVSGEDDLVYTNDVYNKFESEISHVIKGSVDVYKPSTVCKVDGDNIIIFREGIISKDQIIKKLEEVYENRNWK